MADATLVVASLFFIPTSEGASLLPVVVETRQCPSCRSEIKESDCDTLKIKGRAKFYCPVCEVEMREAHQ
jgi:hypothetical protein